MAYLALYREWRPHTFDAIVGQDHVKQTLINALRQKKIVHAYLFSGPRGTGKTTAAKILAKALNCDHPVDFEPCNECPSCKSIDQGTAMEVFEIDAASNRGIDEIRDLREKVKLSAPPGKYKVYIIDEVHMLTTEAFNALLKTIEEPPAQVVFILATTEVQKIPLTILSRVQRFEFYRIPAELILKHMQEICASLGRDVKEEALQVIAQKSEGGLRDALSILDQCLLLDDPIGAEQVYQVLGMVGEGFSSELVDDMLAEDYGRLLADLGEGIQQGKDPRQIIRELLDYLRQVLYHASTGRAPVLAPHLKEKLIEQSGRAGMPRLLKWIDILLQGEGNLKYAGNARLASEMLLVQAVYEKDGRAEGGEESAPRMEEKRKPVAPRTTQSRNRNPSAQSVPAAASPAPAPKKEPPSAPAAEPVQPSAPQKADGLTAEQVLERWGEVQEEVRKRKKSTHAFMLEGNPGRIENQTLALVFREGYSFHKDKMNQNENRQTLEAALESVFKAKLSVRCMMESEAEAMSEGKESDPPRQGETEKAVIKKAEDLFGADLVVVKKGPN